MERSLVLIKPDGVQRGLIGTIITRLEQRGLTLVAAKFVQVNREFAESHYAIHKGRPFFRGLVDYLSSAPVMAMVWEGPEAIAAVRQTMGATNPIEASPGTIRHDYALIISRNLTHASDTLENSEKEIAAWFHPDELIHWTHTQEQWISGEN